MFQLKTFIFLLFLKNSLQLNCTSHVEKEVLFIECGSLSASIEMTIKHRSVVTIKCKGTVNEISELMPKFNDSIIARPIDMIVHKSCPFPANFSDLKSKAHQLSGLKFSNGKLMTLTFQTFKGLEELETLVLRSDRIKFIETNALQCLRRLRSIDLSGNSIKVITAETFQFNFVLSDIKIDSNQVGLTLERCFANKSELREVSVQSVKKYLRLSSHLFANTTNLVALNLSTNVMETFEG